MQKVDRKQYLAFARSAHSSFYEKLSELAFLSELLQEAWFRYARPITVLRPDVDDGGYDLVLTDGRVARHVQLKTTAAESKTSRFNINLGLAETPSGCVVLLVRDDDLEKNRMSLLYRFFGGSPGQPLPDIRGFPVGQRATPNAEGLKPQRRNTRVVSRSKFGAETSIRGLLTALFGRPNDR